MVLCDHLCINIPFKSKYLNCDANGRYQFVNVDLFDLDIKLGSRSVHRQDDGEIKPQLLYHPYESLPTNFTGMALKVYFDSIYDQPYVQIKASPAKLLQGHNVFGTDNIEQGAMEMFGYLFTSYPKFIDFLDISNAWLSHIDVTASIRFKDQHTADQVLAFMRRIQNGQTLLSDKQHKNTVYWGGVSSRLLNHKCYLKHNEYVEQFEDYKLLAKRGDKAAQRVVDVMSDIRLYNWTVGLARFETRMKKRWLERQGIPTKLYDLIELQRKQPDILETLFKKATHSIFAALRGQTMKLTDDHSIYSQISNNLPLASSKRQISVTKVIKVFDFYLCIERHGHRGAKEHYGTQYFTLIGELVKCGFTEDYIGNLPKNHLNNLDHITAYITVYRKLRKVTEPNNVSDLQIQNIYNFYKRLKSEGYITVKKSMSKAQFAKRISALTSCGFSKAYLQNLHDSDSKNIIPFVKLVEIDFNSQLPDWYEPPVSQFNYKLA
ncbi:DNA replication protein [Acinetobacter qingfengensis]|uniref:phage/plasmid replication protein, II/X family n=1 Tax=Acinetobacter qingfengensis TaxID=1262585 RepID=UPI00123A486E|nr:phage/plasmid replication protein, II/X family [Acinetobacter qingfengensis]KAA8730806.1 DNA replication protein [Acinetobacter qingfengensis]